MSNSQRALMGLASRRAELLRHRRKLLLEIQANGRELSSVRKEMRALFPRLRLLGGGAQPTFRHLIRMALARRPMLTTDLTWLVMQRRGLDASDKPLYLATRKRVHACLKELRRYGKVTSIRVPGKPNRWALT